MAGRDNGRKMDERTTAGRWMKGQWQEETMAGRWMKGQWQEDGSKDNGRKMDQRTWDKCDCFCKALNRRTKKKERKKG